MIVHVCVRVCLSCTSRSYKPASKRPKMLGFPTNLCLPASPFVSCSLHLLVSFHAWLPLADFVKFCSSGVGLPLSFRAPTCLRGYCSLIPCYVGLGRVCQGFAGMSCMSAFCLRCGDGAFMCGCCGCFFICFAVVGSYRSILLFLAGVIVLCLLCCA